MVKVYFETPNGSFAEEVATFTSDDLYNVCLPILEQHANSIRMVVTESVEEESEG